ncbi:hypothetical protein [Sinomicrobium weinanense]|uniref:Uncharacterized protein n=1 Tax=Sinomicrobium weinanense TaxID=2842200 RepID=A0A926JUM2_9FLAO|nr:hypothetical protein [Sinomicrobium weinanense]MBC9797865.1 hypothetical protein [Sinomicrobium weinanense]MBU3122235.1 hypothetical protein [Sinomicrobium weinanense]
MSELISIKQPFAERYTLTIDSDLMAVNMNMKSKAQIRWDFRVLNVDSIGGDMEVELIQLDNILLESNNPMVKEVSAMSRIFGRMYNELHLTLDKSGKIMDVLNMDLILRKWKQTKREMQEVVEENDDLKQVINLNDEIFQNQANLKAAIQASEFFSVCFGEIYGEYIHTQKTVVKPNFLNTANVQWAYSIYTDNDNTYDSGCISIYAKADPHGGLGQGFNQRAYKNFSQQIDVGKLEPVLAEHITFGVERQTGKLLEALVRKEEIAQQESLYTKMNYHVISDTLLKENRRVITE